MEQSSEGYPWAIDGLIFEQDFTKIGRIVAQDAEEILCKWYERAQHQQVHAGSTDMEEMKDELVAGLRVLGEKLQGETEETDVEGGAAAEHGIFRWQAGWDVAEVVRDYVILQQVTILHIAEKLEHRLTYQEAMALAVVFDLAIEKAVRAHAAEVEKRNAEINDLRRSNRDLEQFVYIASHDLQEPLRMVTSYGELLQSRRRDKLDDKTNQFVGFMVDGATRMRHLVDDLLAYSQVSMGDHHMAPVSAEAALERSLKNLQTSLQQTAAVVTHDPLPTVMAHDVQLAQLLQNLISNAIKFHRPGEKPMVHVSACENGEQYVFSVRDNGIGIAPAHQEQVFVIFRRLHTRQEYPGTGIGLAICKRIVERHGGRIWVDSAPGQGSTFYFTIPAATAAQS